MTKIVKAIAAVLRLLGIKAGDGSRYCDECGAWPGRPCKDPYCYGSLGQDPQELTLAGQLDEIRKAAAAAKNGKPSKQQLTAAVLIAAQLVDELRMRSYDVTLGTDDRLEQLVVEVHGVEVSIRGRDSDVYVNVTDERDDEDRAEFPLSLVLRDTLMN